MIVRYIAAYTLGRINLNPLIEYCPKHTEMLREFTKVSSFYTFHPSCSPTISIAHVADIVRGKLRGAVVDVVGCIGIAARPTRFRHRLRLDMCAKGERVIGSSIKLLARHL